MNMKSTKLFIVLALTVAGGFAAAAQSSGVPGDTDYPAFSHFITDRNIFDPARYPHEVRSTRPRTRTRYNSSPAFSLVGTMNYGKGWFAFFSGNSYDLKQILPVSGSIQGYQVTAITLTNVALAGPDKKTLTMEIGDKMRQDNNGWRLEPRNDAFGAASDLGSSSSAGGSNSSSGTGAATPPAAVSSSVENNDVLKRLMQLRQQENK
jgi:hypothetical protein